MVERRRNTTHGVLRGPGPACCHRTRPPGARTRGGRGEAAGWQRCRRTPRPPHCLCSDPWHAAVPKILAVNASGTAVNAFLPLLVCSAVSARSCLPLSACHRDIEVEGAVHNARGPSPVARGRRKGPSRTAVIRPVDRDRTPAIQRTGEAQGVDGISFPVKGWTVSCPAQAQAGRRH